MSETPRNPPGVVGTAWRVATKELVASCRDRQTLIYTLVLPLCLYPALFWVWIQGMVLVRGRAEATQVEVAVVAVDAVGPDRWWEVVESDDVVVQTTDADPRTLVRSGTHRPPFDAALAFGDSAEGARRTELYYDSTRARSEIARQRVGAAATEYARAHRRERSGGAGLTPTDLEPFQVEEHNLASRRDMGGFLLSFLLPLTFVLMATMGAFLPAVDLTAGERERRTLETTLALPVSRLGIQMGKIGAVALLALIAAALNLVGMALAARGLLAALPDGRALDIEIPASALLAIAPFAVLFAIFVSAVLLAVAATADTFRQGQSLMGTLQLAFVLPAMVTVLPGVELTSALALVPVVNVVLAFKALLQPGADTGVVPLLLVALSLATYAAVAAALASRWMASERVQLGLTSGFGLLRKKRGHA